MATLVGTTGASRSVAVERDGNVYARQQVDGATAPSVTIPSVPSAPMNNLVVSKPADDLRARRRVLITFPFGRTTVYSDFITHDALLRSQSTTYDVEKPFSLSGPVSNSVC